jgi:NDP-sugar pyrophosphorylase family protein
MLQIAGKPILEHIITGARNQGFRNIALAVHHLAEVIENYFGDGSSSGVEIQYLREEFPLGTAGALSLINPPPKEDILVINGDVITDLRFERILDFHEQFQAMGTMAVQMHELQNPFGVVNTSGVEIVSYEEKPSTHSMINAGIYVLDPSAVSLLEPKTYFSMPALFERLRENGYKTIAYPIHEKWTDIGRHDDFAKAEMDM